MKILELGGGTSRHPRAEVSLDIHHPWPPGSGAVDLAREAWPVASDSYDMVYSSHLLEHIPKGDATIHVFNEALRVLKPGGRFVNIMPVVGFTPNDASIPPRMVVSWQPWADPTHIQFWWLPESVLYLNGQFGANADYGIHSGWRPLGQEIPEQEARAELSSVKGSGYAVDRASWWAIMGGWEGAFSLVKA